MQAITHQTKTKTAPLTRTRPGQPARRPAEWRPETSPLSREELRRIILKQLG